VTVSCASDAANRFVSAGWLRCILPIERTIPLLIMLNRGIIKKRCLFLAKNIYREGRSSFSGALFLSLFQKVAGPTATPFSKTETVRFFLKKFLKVHSSAVREK
jgi:hypothetical protein